MPRSQYFPKETKIQDDQQVLVTTTKPGTVVLMHYDLVHKRIANISKSDIRFMFRLQFVRCQEPTNNQHLPSWPIHLQQDSPSEIIAKCLWVSMYCCKQDLDFVNQLVNN